MSRVRFDLRGGRMFITSIRWFFIAVAVLSIITLGFLLATF